MKEYTKQKELIHGKKYLISRFSVYMSSLSLKTGILRHKETFIGTFEFTKEYYVDEPAYYMCISHFSDVELVYTTRMTIDSTREEQIRILEEKPLNERKFCIKSFTNTWYTSYYFEEHYVSSLKELVVNVIDKDEDLLDEMNKFPFIKMIYDETKERN
jgi:hypothetical protein